MKTKQLHKVTLKMQDFWAHTQHKVYKSKKAYTRKNNLLTLKDFQILVNGNYLWLKKWMFNIIWVFVLDLF